MVFEAHDRAFAFFGGVCRRSIYDNMKTAVSTVFVGRERAYNRRFQVQNLAIVGLAFGNSSILDYIVANLAEIAHQFGFYAVFQVAAVSVRFGFPVLCP